MVWQKPGGGRGFARGGNCSLQQQTDHNWERIGQGEGGDSMLARAHGLRLPGMLCAWACGLSVLVPLQADEPIRTSVVVAGVRSRAPGPQHASQPTPDSELTYPGLTTVAQGTSASGQRKQSVAALSLQGLPPADLASAQQVLGNIGLFRKLPTYRFAVDPAVYHYLLDHPDVAVQTWRAMGISRFALQQTGEGQFHADAGDGSAGDVKVLYSTPTETLIYCTGAFKSPLVNKPIVARSLMRLQTEFTPQPEGHHLATHTGDVFVEFPSQTVEAVARLISPVSNTIADRNFKQLTLYAYMMSQAVIEQPAWIEVLAERMEISDPERQQFLELAQQRQAARGQPNPVDVGTVLSPQDVIRPWQQAYGEPMSALVPAGASSPAVTPAPLGTGTSVPMGATVPMGVSVPAGITRTAAAPVAVSPMSLRR